MYHMKSSRWLSEAMHETPRSPASCGGATAEPSIVKKTSVAEAKQSKKKHKCSTRAVHGACHSHGAVLASWMGHVPGVQVVMVHSCKEVRGEKSKRYRPRQLSNELPTVLEHARYGSDFFGAKIVACGIGCEGSMGHLAPRRH